MANESTTYDPHSMDETLNEIYSLNLDGRIIKNKNNTWRMRTNRELRQDARALATGTNDTGRMYTAEDYANGNVMFSGGKKRRQRIFDRTFKRHYNPTSTENETEDNIEDNVALHHNTQSMIDPTKLSSHKLNNLSPEEQQSVARWWRDPSRLLGQIGGRMEDPIANAHARTYVEPLTDAAFYGIGPAMLGTNPATTMLVDEGLGAVKNVWSKAAPHIDKAGQWVQTQNQWWNPIQMVRTVMNPSNARTAVGQVTGATVDTYGLYEGATGMNDLYNKWTSDQFDWQDLADAGKNIVSMVPGASSVYKAGKNMFNGVKHGIDYSSKLYNAVRTGSRIPTFSNYNTGIDQLPVTHDIQAFSDYITPAHSNIPSQFNKVVNKFQNIQNKIGSYVDDFKHSRYGDTYDLYEMGNNVRKDVKTMKKNFSDYYSIYNALEPGYSDDPIES